MGTNRHDRQADALAARIGAVRRATPAARAVAGAAKAYASLVTRYDFAPFHMGEVVFLGTDEARDYGLTRALTQHGYVQVGRPDDGSYDPVCLNGEFLVRLDHEAILLSEKIRVVAVIADAFWRFAQEAPVSDD